MVSYDAKRDRKSFSIVLLYIKDNTTDTTTSNNNSKATHNSEENTIADRVIWIEQQSNCIHSNASFVIALNSILSQCLVVDVSSAQIW